jgi:hypothetical protein
MRNLPPWIYPPKNYIPFLFAPNEITVTAAGIVIGDFQTPPAWTRISHILFKSVNAIDVTMNFHCNGSGDFSTFILTSTANFQLEFPVFIRIPPVSRVRWTASNVINNVCKFRLVGWSYFE